MRLAIACLALAACDWTSFDTLSDETWAHSQQNPNLGSTDYAVAIAGAASNALGGELAVVSNDEPTYSTLVFDPKGTTGVGSGSTIRLGNDAIDSLGDQPILIADNTGDVALVAESMDAGHIAVVAGPVDAPTDMTFASTAAGPDAAAFAGPELVIAAGAQLSVVDSSGAVTCAANDTGGAAIPGAGAIAADDTNAWVWTSTGALLSYSLSALGSTCQPPSASAPPTISATAAAFTTTGFSPGAGARVFLVPQSGTAKFAVLAAHADKSTAGQVFVVDLTAKTAVGSPLDADDLASAAIGSLGDSGKLYVALGFPDRSVGSTQSGLVELHAIDPNSGTLNADADATFNDDQPDNGQEFGRSVTTMEFNGATILVVAAKSEIFAYYQTILYSDTRPAQ